jgi:H/ACA ribonucleoprotein complex subunit 4
MDAFVEPNEVLLRKSASTDESLGSYPKDRDIKSLVNYGIVNINKPKGPSSHQVSAFVQQILGLDKSGHSGTLDPAVTGVLPIALGKATRIVQAILPAGKEYVALMHLHKEVEESQLRKALDIFHGEITQLPPIKSAVKRQERQRTIYYIEVLEIDGPDVLFRVGCQAGTYIRKLCHDIGRSLGVGAHMAELVRTKAGPFDETTMVALDDLRDAYHYYKLENSDVWLRKIVLPMEYSLKLMPKIWVYDSTVEPLCHGADLAIPGISKMHSCINPGETVAVMTLKDELIALGYAKVFSKEMLGEKGIAAKIHKVFMEPGTYLKK